MHQRLDYVFLKCGAAQFTPIWEHLCRYFALKKPQKRSAKLSLMQPCTASCVNIWYTGALWLAKGCTSLKIHFLVKYNMANSSIECKSGFSCQPICIVTALRGMHTQSSNENSVCLSVRLSVCTSVCLSNTSIVTKLKKNLSRFLYSAKVHLA